MRFVLIHGAAVGGSCWSRLVPELEAMGHVAVTPDLPGSGERRDERATLAGYRDTVVELLREGDVLVGHSMAGNVITMAADVAPERIGHMIYLAAAVPVDGKSMVAETSLDDLGMDRFVTISETPNGPAFTLNSVEDGIELWYSDFSREDAEWAFGMSTPQQLAPLQEPITVSRFWSSDIPRSYLLCTRDNSGIVPIAAAQLERLGLRSAYLMDTAHYPFITQPRRTAEVLVGAASSSLQAS